MRLADALMVDRDEMLAMVGRIQEDVLDLYIKNPKKWAKEIRDFYCPVEAVNAGQESISNSHPMPTTKRRVDLDGADFYPTPAWATFALTLKEVFHGNIWECACGDGEMSEVA